MPWFGSGRGRAAGVAGDDRPAGAVASAIPSPPIATGVAANQWILHSRVPALAELGWRRLAVRLIPGDPASVTAALIDGRLREQVWGWRLPDRSMPDADQHWDFFETCVPIQRLEAFRRRFPEAQPNPGRGRIRCPRGTHRLVIIPRETPRRRLIEMLETGWLDRIAGSHWE